MNFFRRHLESNVTRVIALVIAIIFVGWEFGSAMLKSKNTWLIKVGDIEYNGKDWQNNYRAITKDPLSSQEALANPQYAKKRVLEEMIRNALILQEATKVGFRANDKMAASEVVNMKIFRSEDGKFDKEKFDKTLQNNNLTEAEFMKGMRESILRNNLMDIFYNTSGIMSRSTYDLIVKLVAAEQNLIMYSVGKFDGDINYEEYDLKKFLEENKERFTTPDQFYISKVLFTGNLIKKEEITDEEIKEFYEKNAAVEPERRSVNQVVVPSYNDAKKVLERIKSGKISYDDAAKIYSGQQMIPYEIGPFVSEGFDEDIAKVVFSLPEGGISDLVQTPLGWHIFRVNKVYEAKAKDLAELKNDIRDKLKEQKFIDNMHETVKNVMNDIDANMTIEDIAKKYNLSIKKDIEKAKRLHDGRIDVSSITQDALDDGVSKRKIILAATTEDNYIKMIASKNNKSFMILHRDKIVPGTLMAFNQIEKELQEAYISQEIDKKTSKIAKELRKKVVDSEDRSKPINDEKITYQRLKFSRINDNNAIPDCIKDLVLTMHQNNVFDGVTGVCKSGNSYLFAALNNLDFTRKISDTEKATMKQMIHTLYNEMIFDQFINSLKREYKIELDDRFVEYLNE